MSLIVRGKKGEYPIAKTFNILINSNNRYEIDGKESHTIRLFRGQRYVFHQTDYSMTSHPFILTESATTIVEYKKGLKIMIPGKYEFMVPWDAPSSMYYCSKSNSNIRGSIEIRDMVPEDPMYRIAIFLSEEYEHYNQNGLGNFQIIVNKANSYIEFGTQPYLITDMNTITSSDKTTFTIHTHGLWKLTSEVNLCLFDKYVVCDMLYCFLLSTDGGENFIPFRPNHYTKSNVANTNDEMVDYVREIDTLHVLYKEGDAHPPQFKVYLKVNITKQDNTTDSQFDACGNVINWIWMRVTNAKLTCECMTTRTSNIFVNQNVLT